MAAGWFTCLSCGEEFWRRQSTQDYCRKDDCQREHNRVKVSRWRKTPATVLEAGRQRRELA